MTELFDTHVHLLDEKFSADRDIVIERASETGVHEMIEIADSPADWDRAVALARARPTALPAKVRCSLGLHPYHAQEFSEELARVLEKKVRLPEVVAVGEIGLDYVKSEVPASVQRAAFERLLAAAKGWDVPAVVHCRGAYADLLAILKNLFAGPPTRRRFWGVIHCFSGNAEEAEACAGLGFALGVDGPITYPKNDALREALRAAGPGVLVLETDSPYLPPQSSRGKRNEPALLPEIARRLAELLGLGLEELGRVTTDNARALYRRNSPGLDRNAKRL